LSSGVGVSTGRFNLSLTFVDATLKVLDLGGELRALLFGLAGGRLANLGDLAIRISTHFGLGVLGRVGSNASTGLLSRLGQFILKGPKL
jgi:hypothetical protein